MQRDLVERPATDRLVLASSTASSARRGGRVPRAQPRFVRAPGIARRLRVLGLPRPRSRLVSSRWAWRPGRTPTEACHLTIFHVALRPRSYPTRTGTGCCSSRSRSRRRAMSQTSQSRTRTRFTDDRGDRAQRAEDLPVVLEPVLTDDNVVGLAAVDARQNRPGPRHAFVGQRRSGFRVLHVVTTRPGQWCTRRRRPQIRITGQQLCPPPGAV